MFGADGAGAAAGSPLAVSVVAGAVVAGAWVILRLRGAGVRWRAATLVAVGGLTFQAVHGFEHALQLLHWLSAPGSPPWMSSWALAGRDALAAVSGRSPMVGTELLHLTGNAIFLAGLLGVGRVLPVVGVSPAWRTALRLQSAHVVEHLLLTGTAVGVGRSIGVTTLLGTIEPTSAAAIGLRVCSHFALNAIPTVLVAWAMAGPGRAGSPGPVAAGRGVA